MNIKSLNFNEMHGWLKKRPKTSHKGLFGHVLILGGDYGMPGAVRLAASGALQMGAGLVTVITRPEHISSVTVNQPELLCYGLELTDFELLKEQLTKASIVVLGPGLGQSSWSKFLYDRTIQYVQTDQVPCLIDADGLNLIAQNTSTFKAGNHFILTPHPGEAGRLLKKTIETIQKHRVESIQALQKKWGGVVVLKGYESLICTTKEPILVCKAGNPAMASGGMGDLLSGIIAGLVTQGLNLWQAVQMGVLLHATAGDKALEIKGGPSLLASDLLPELKPLLKDLVQL